MKYRKLRIVWSAAWGVVAVLLCVWWMRSYYYTDFRGGQIVSMNGNLYITEMLGILPAESSPTYTPTVFGTHTIAATRVTVQPINVVVRFPQWLMMIPAILLATAPWLRFRFSLRTLLIATMLVAVVLELLVWSLR